MGGTKGGGPEGWEAEIFALFLPLPPHFRSFSLSLSLGVFSWNFGGVCSARALKCTLLEPASPNVHILGSRRSKTPPKSNEKTTQRERQKERKFDWPKFDWPKMDWPKFYWPKLVKSGWPKRDWPKSVPSFVPGRTGRGRFPGRGGGRSFRSWPTLAKPTLANFSVSVFWPNFQPKKVKPQRPKDLHSDLDPKHSRPKPQNLGRGGPTLRDPTLRAPFHNFL